MDLKELLEPGEPEPIVILIGSKNVVDWEAALAKAGKDHGLIVVAPEGTDIHDVESFLNAGVAKWIKPAEPTLLAEDQFLSQPFMVKSMGREQYYDYKDVPKKGKNSWKSPHKFHS